MTLQQLKYALAVAEKGSINEAAKALFLSQPSLSSALQELEKELGVTIFLRTNRGAVATTEGAEFLAYARQVMQQVNLLEEKFLGGGPAKQRFSVSTQHYSFTANAFVELIKEFGGEEYEFTLREAPTYEIIEDVRSLRSELGVLYLSDFNEQIIRKLLKERDLLFSPLFTAKPHVFLRREHPLAEKTLVGLEELEQYPCITFNQGERNSFYFSEEILSTLTHRKSIRVTDRAALINLMIGVDGFTIATGVFPSYLHGKEIVAVRLDVDEEIRVGVITHKDVTLTRLGEIYLGALRKIAEELSG